jgi:hypothetical protein
VPARAKRLPCFVELELGLLGELLVGSLVGLVELLVELDVVLSRQF